MDLLTTSLDALLDKAINIETGKPNSNAVEAFCALMSKEPDGNTVGLKLLAARIHSQSETISLQTIDILDTCMKSCGTSFRQEAGKFRFLNELIKLVSPKYLGQQTSPNIKQRILCLLDNWSQKFPKESKIKEAYDMLKKQGVMKQEDLPVNRVPDSIQTKQQTSIFENDERTQVLHKLLQSKKPHELQAANRLIKMIVKEGEKREEGKYRLRSEIDEINSNANLLQEMVQSYSPGKSSKDELDLIEELYKSCKHLQNSICKSLTESTVEGDILGEALEAKTFLDSVIEACTSFISNSSTLTVPNSLVDITTDSTISLTSEATETSACQSDIDSLLDILTKSSKEEISLSDSSCLAPTSSSTENADKDSAPRSAFEELDLLSANLVKEYLAESQTKERAPDQILEPLSAIEKGSNDLEKILDDIMLSDEPLVVEIDCNNKNSQMLLNNRIGDSFPVCKSANDASNQQTSLNNLQITLDSIKPKSLDPIILFEDKTGVSLEVHFAESPPNHRSVNVFVVTAVNKKSVPLSNFLFRATSPKEYKIKLQQPSGTDLPAYNRFAPPAALTQIMLVTGPRGATTLPVKFMVTFSSGDEMVTEIGDVELQLSET